MKMVVCGGSNQYQNWSSFVVGVIAYFAFLITRKIVRKFKSNYARHSKFKKQNLSHYFQLMTYWIAYPYILALVKHRSFK